MELRLQSGLVAQGGSGWNDSGGSGVDWLVHWVGLGGTWRDSCGDPWCPECGAFLQLFHFSLQRNSRINTGGSGPSGLLGSMN